jgi:hypothetical protein
MKTKLNNSSERVCLELKYCERCGALRLRPAGGEEIYCVACARQMAELPPASWEMDTARVPQGPGWGARGGEREWQEGDDDVDIDAFGGVA